mmetsp:Transcript_17381/g.37846  ORF Transcript_17381/g.37846 Transcript_17381/m.37846 type:complete len:1177 (-) Transcript_17381:97-3627(-)
MSESDEANTVTPTNPASNSNDSPSNNNIKNNNDSNNYDPHASRRLLSSSYRAFQPIEMGDRYVAFLLRNERTMSALQSHVLMDHLAVIRQLGGDAATHMNLDHFGSAAAGNAQNAGASMTMGAVEEEKKKRSCGSASIEIDAFQLLSLDPVLGNLTLRYPDTLLPLLEDSTVQSRKVLRRRMEVAIQSSLDKMKRQKSDMSIKNEIYKKEVNNMIQMLQALKHTSEWYDPRPLHARLVHLPPHLQFCKPTLSSISSADVGTVVQICGTCVRAGPVRMMETIRTYRCLGKGCGHEFGFNADFGTTNNALPCPAVCPLAHQNECRSTSFAIVPDGSEHADYQEMKVQESASALNRVGSVPRSLLIKLSDDLVDRCNPGDEVVVVGELKAEWQNQSLGPNVEVMVGMSMLAHSVRVVNIDEEMAGGGTTSMADLGLVGGGGIGNAAAAMAASSGNLREKFRREFDAFWSDASAKLHPFGTRDYIARAVCPKLYGMHAVKLGLLLVLIGGASVSSTDLETITGEDETNGNTDEHRDEEFQVDSDEEAPVAFKIGGDDNDDEDFTKQDENRTKNGKRKKPNKGGKAIKSRRRIQSHILLIGDPGTGKSQFLRFAAALSPRSVLTTGTGSSTAGLTCAAVRDSSAGSSGNEFSLEAGALALADRGVCCIDEFGCMSKEDRTSIHEAMEQQTISVAKAGIICKLNARATVVAVMNPNGGIYDNEQTLEENSRLGSALLSRFDLIFLMLDQAECGRDENIAHFLLQQSITPGSGYDRPLEMESLVDDGNVNGHWGMEKLRAYIATIREKFHPTLTPEASELLENHYSLCRQQKKNGQSLITVRFLESLIRLSQAHARLMYRDKVLLDDAVAVILLMECTAAASPDDTTLHKSPVDTEFVPFDRAGALFEAEKETLLQRYQTQSKPNHGGMTPPPFGSNNQRASKYPTWDDVEQRRVQHHPPFAGNRQDRNDLRDQWGRRQMLSQAASPLPHSQNSSIRRVVDSMDPNQYTPASIRGSCTPHSEKRVDFSRGTLPGTVEGRSGMHQSFDGHQDLSYGNDDGYCNGSRPDNHNYQHDVQVIPRQQGNYPFRRGDNPNGQNFEAPQEQERPRSGGFLHQDDGSQMQAEKYTHELEMQHGHAAPLSQQVELSRANAHGNYDAIEQPNRSHMSNRGSSGKRRKKRRNAD